MALEEIRPGLHRWTARHPDWGSEQSAGDGWGPDVASVAWTGAEDALVLIDPLVLDDATGEEIWRELDALVEAHGGPVAVVITCKWHARSGDKARRRYVDLGSAIHTETSPGQELPYEVTHPFEGRTELPGGLTAYPAEYVPAESVLWIEAAKTIVVGDAFLGAEGNRTETLKMSSEDWFEGTPREAVRDALKPLLDLDVQAIVPLHGAPVLENAGDHLRRALTAE